VDLAVGVDNGGVADGVALPGDVCSRDHDRLIGYSLQTQCISSKVAHESELCYHKTTRDGGALATRRQMV
jgi:hypothetical protein